MGTRAALLVGTGNYSDPAFAALRAVATDTEDLRRVLEDGEIGDYEVVVLSDPTRQELALAVDEFFDSRSFDDTLLLYFSCHGIKDKRGELHLVAHDTQVKRLAATAIPASYVQDRIEDSAAKSVLVLLDCCYSGAFSRDKVHRTGSSEVTLDELPGRGTAVLTASTALEYAFEGSELEDLNQPHTSYFTRAVIDGLESGEADVSNDGWVSVDDLHNFVTARLGKLNTGQHPTRSMKEQGQLRVAKRAPAARGVRRFGSRDYFGVAGIQQVALRVDGAPELYSIAFSHDSRFMAAGAEDGALVWELPVVEDQQPAHRLDHPRYVYATAFSKDGSTLVTTCEDGGVRFWDWRSELLLEENLTAHRDSVYSIARSSDGSLLATGGYDGRVVLWNARTMTPVEERVSQGRVSSVSFAREADLLAFATHDDKVFLWNREDNELVQLGEHQSSVECVALSSDGSLAVSCGLDKRVTLWDVATARSRWSPRPVHSYLVKSVVFSPDAEVIASAGWDQIVYLWDVRHPGVRQKFPWRPDLRWHTDWIWSVAFSPDGKMLATAGSDGLVVLMSFANKEMSAG